VTPRVVFITDPRFDLARTARAIRAAAEAVGSQGLVVQLRDKAADAASLVAAARALREVTRDVGALLVVNGPPSIAREVDADGVHVPSVGGVTDARELLGDAAFVTTSAHHDDDVRAASAAGATGVLVSPIFATPGKGAPRGLPAITAARAIVDAARRTPPMLVYALGGVTRANAALCRGAGADGVAAIRALYDEPELGPWAMAVSVDEC
jgi:thiamine-phosphate pyrophosphorylase